MIFHPDKIAQHNRTFNANDVPDASLAFSSAEKTPGAVLDVLDEQFQEISRAYAVLIDPDARAFYDRHGEEAMEKAMALSIPLSQAQDLKDYLEREKRKQKEALEDQAFSCTTSCVAYVDAALLPDLDGRLADMAETMKISVRDRMPVLSHLVVNLNYEKRLLASPIMLSGSVRSTVYPNEGEGSVSILGQASRRLYGNDKGDHEGSLIISGGLAENGSFHIGPQLALQFSSRNIMNFGGTLIFVGNRIIPTYRSVFKHVISDSLIASLTLGGSLRKEATSVTLGLDWMAAEQRSSFGVSASASLRSVSTVMKVKHRLTDELAVSTSLSTSSDQDVDWSAMLKRRTTALTTIIIGCGFSSEYGFLAKVGFYRKRVKLVLPIVLAYGDTWTSISMSSMLFGTLAYCFDKFILQRFVEQEHDEELRTFQRERAELLLKKKIQAMSAISTMQGHAEKKRRSEAQIGGLQILVAYYGASDGILKSGFAFGDTEVIDVTVPLQCLVNNSRLELHAHSKAYLVGFYDPCLGRQKRLRIDYEYQGKLHRAVIDDVDSLLLPRATDLLA